MLLLVDLRNMTSSCRRLRKAALPAALDRGLVSLAGDLKAPHEALRLLSELDFFAPQLRQFQEQDPCAGLLYVLQLLENEVTYQAQTSPELLLRKPWPLHASPKWRGLRLQSQGGHAATQPSSEVTLTSPSDSELAASTMTTTMSSLLCSSSHSLDSCEGLACCSPLSQGASSCGREVQQDTLPVCGAVVLEQGECHEEDCPCPALQPPAECFSSCYAAPEAALAPYDVQSNAAFQPHQVRTRVDVLCRLLLLTSPEAHVHTYACKGGPSSSPYPARLI